MRVDDLVLGQLRSRFRVGGTNLDIHRWLSEQIQLEDDPQGQPRLVLQTGVQEGATSFRVVGHRISLDVERRDAHYQVRRVVMAGAHQGAALQLVFARLALVDASATSGMTSIAQQQLEQALLSGDSYLELWRSYQQLDEQMVQDQATAFGVLAYDHVEQRGTALRFRLVNAEQAAGARERFDMPGLRIEATEHDTPTVISRETPARSSRRETHFVAPLRRLSYDGRFVEVEAPDDGTPPPPHGHLRLSMRGDEVRLRRRHTAEERLRSGNLPLPHLGLLLEGKNPVVPRYARRTPSRKVLHEAFTGTPTEMQRRAIDIAINTPDIVLIQGPPGTGKTQVITALQRCLAELGERDGERHHRILVTSTQHEAVDNVIARTSIFGVPAVKVGRSRQEAASMDGVERWRQAQISKLQARSAVESEPDKRLRARRLAVRCLLAPAGTDKLREELSELERLVVGEVQPALGERLRALVHRLATPLSSPDQELHELEHRCAQSISLDPIDFTDGGPRRAEKALHRLGSQLTPDERSFLERCADWSAPGAPHWLATEGPPLIEPLRERLARRATTGPAPGLTPDDGSLVRELLDDMARSYRNGRDRAQGVVADYLDDLTNDSAGLRRAIQHYTVVLAATCQQAASERMLAARELADGAVTFETVIVDEAARSHPLDLFIPMTMAQRRIVLVGDHRQLPHMLEPDVERAFLDRHESSPDALRPDAEASTSLEEPLRQSLFARLWAQLKQLEARDGISRTITLDTQFRMHPVLGRYVSEQFYERGADPVKLTSVLPPGRFTHSLGRYQRDGRPCCAAWLDVPASQGRERQGRSKSRPAEAHQVAAAVRALLDESADLTIGVITFYAAQVDLVCEELAPSGITERTDVGDWQVSDAYRRARDAHGLPIERVRIGTVDSFQGKEFDVVILSVVRSNDLPAADEVQRRRKYGHLLLANRLCVAMSRQRRLLVVAGDRRFVRQATELPQLHAFQSLCEGPDGCVL